MALLIQHLFKSRAPFRFFKYLFLDALGECYINGRNDICYGQEVCVYGPITIEMPPNDVDLQGWIGKLDLNRCNTVLFQADFCWRTKFDELHSLFSSLFLKVTETNIVFLETKYSSESILKMCQLSHLWKGQRLRISVYYPNLPARLLQLLATAQILVVQIFFNYVNTYRGKLLNNRKEMCIEKVGDKSAALVPGTSPLDYSQLQQCHQLVVVMYGKTEVNIADVVNYLNTNPLATNFTRELYLVTGYFSQLDPDRLLESLQKVNYF
uniref:Uncharacterized protein n=1 Tax=Ditylenchus dipsaci TaxID=166011 RepID=A0A915CU41_9BILA